MLLGAWRAEHAVALVLAVAVEVALVLVADADVALEVDVVILRGWKSVQRFVVMSRQRKAANHFAAIGVLI